MTRLPAHERIFAAQRAGTLERLVGEGIPRDWAEAWLTSWEGGAADMHALRRDPEFWEQGYQYAHGANVRGERPPPPPDTSSDERDPAS